MVSSDLGMTSQRSGGRLTTLNYLSGGKSSIFFLLKKILVIIHFLLLFVAFLSKLLFVDL